MNFSGTVLGVIFSPQIGEIQHRLKLFSKLNGYLRGWLPGTLADWQTGTSIIGTSIKRT